MRLRSPDNRYRTIFIAELSSNIAGHMTRHLLVSDDPYAASLDELVISPKNVKKIAKAANRLAIEILDDLARRFKEQDEQEEDHEE